MRGVFGEVGVGLRGVLGEGRAVMTGWGGDLRVGFLGVVLVGAVLRFRGMLRFLDSGM